MFSFNNDYIPLDHLKRTVKYLLYDQLRDQLAGLNTAVRQCSRVTYRRVFFRAFVPSPDGEDRFEVRIELFQIRETNEPSCRP